MNRCFRVYNNMTRTVTEDVSDADLPKWIEFNTTARFGCAQVINGKVTYRGYLDAERLKIFDSTVIDEVPDADMAVACSLINRTLKNNV